MRSVTPSASPASFGWSLLACGASGANVSPSAATLPPFRAAPASTSSNKPAPVAISAESCAGGHPGPQRRKCRCDIAQALDAGTDADRGQRRIRRRWPSAPIVGMVLLERTMPFAEADDHVVQDLHPQVCPVVDQANRALL